MKRDFDLIRDALLFIEEEYGHSGHHASPADNSALYQSLFKKYDESLCFYNVELMVKANLVDNYVSGKLEGKRQKIIGITWEGHEYLDSIRDPSVWKKVKEKFTKNSGSVSLAVVQKLAEESVLSALGYT